MIDHIPNIIGKVESITKHGILITMGNTFVNIQFMSYFSRLFKSTTMTFTHKVLHHGPCGRSQDNKTDKTVKLGESVFKNTGTYKD